MTLPTGTLIFLFTDIEGSTRLWDECPQEMQIALTRHDLLVREAINSTGGTVFKAVGDAFCAVFLDAPAALAATLAAQRALKNEVWDTPRPIRVRMAVHSGTAELRDGDYYGGTLNRVARVLSIAHGGQTLVSAAAYELARDALPLGSILKDLGLYRLKDLSRPEQIFQMIHPDLTDAFRPLRSLDNAPNNLPQQFSSFVGREKEIAEVKRLISAGTRLLTLTGTGGCGKSRLVLQVAADLLDSYQNGAWLVELASLVDPSLVPQAVASVLSVREDEKSASVQEILVEYLKQKSLLLILDNCEHLLDACATLVNVLLRSCPGITVLLTSRTALGITGESIYRVPSLTTPDAKNLPSLESLNQYEAVRLFIERALLSQPGFAITNANAPALAAVCQRLDGIPLAIELAAARIRALSIEDINQRLDNCFRLLTSGSRTALPRQQTLRALIDWSYDLLSEQEKVLLTRLSVFAGGWTPDAVEAICADSNRSRSDGEPTSIEDWEVIDLLTSLVDKSLVTFYEYEGTTRYSLLETVRQYSREKLDASGKAHIINAAHCGYFRAFAQEAEIGLKGPDQVRDMGRLVAEDANMRTALSWGGSIQSEDAILLAAALRTYWLFRGWGQHRGGTALFAYSSEGMNWLSQALAWSANASDRTRARVLRAAGDLYGTNSETGARALLEEGLHLARRVGDVALTVSMLISLGTNLKSVDAYTSRTHLEEALRTAETANDYALASDALYELCTLSLMENDGETALFYADRGFEYGQVAGHLRGMAITRLGGTQAAAVLGDLEGAQRRGQQSLEIWEVIGEVLSISFALFLLANIAYRRGDWHDARRWKAREVTLWREIPGQSDRWGNAMFWLANYTRDCGEIEESASLFRELRAAAQSWGSANTVAWCDVGTGNAELLMGNYHSAQGLYASALTHFRRSGDTSAVAHILERVAFLKTAAGRYIDAVHLLGNASALRTLTNHPVSLDDRREYYDSLVTRLEEEIGGEMFRAEIVFGETLQPEEVQALVTSNEGIRK